MTGLVADHLNKLASLLNEAGTGPLDIARHLIDAAVCALKAEPQYRPIREMLDEVCTAIPGETDAVEMEAVDRLTSARSGNCRAN